MQTPLIPGSHSGGIFRGCTYQLLCRFIGRRHEVVFDPSSGVNCIVGKALAALQLLVFQGSCWFLDVLLAPFAAYSDFVTTRAGLVPGVPEPCLQSPCRCSAAVPEGLVSSHSAGRPPPSQSVLTCTRGDPVQRKRIYVKRGKGLKLQRTVASTAVSRGGEGPFDGVVLSRTHRAAVSLNRQPKEVKCA